MHGRDRRHQVNNTRNYGLSLAARSMWNYIGVWDISQESSNFNALFGEEPVLGGLIPSFIHKQ